MNSIEHDQIDRRQRRIRGIDIGSHMNDAPFELIIRNPINRVIEESKS
jgi:hypothetical protein